MYFFIDFLQIIRFCVWNRPYCTGLKVIRFYILGLREVCSIHAVQWDNDCRIFCYNPQVPRHRPFSMKYLLHHSLMYLVAWLLCCVSTDLATQRDWQPGVIYEMPDSIPGLLDCSLARFWWAIISHFNEHQITSHYL